MTFSGQGRLPSNHPSNQGDLDRAGPLRQRSLVCSLAFASRLVVQYSNINWHKLPRTAGPRLARLYRRSQRSWVGKKAFSVFILLWAAACKGASSALDVALQLMVITMCSKWVQLVQLTEFSSIVASLRGVRAKQRQCGLREEPPNWTAFTIDGLMLESVLLLFLPVGTMIFFFYVPMSECQR